MPVMRDEKSKWFISKSDYESDYFSQYCSGSAYIISGDLIYPMYQNSFQTRFFWVDDFYITGLLTKNLNVTYHNMGSLYVLRGTDLQAQLVDSYSIFGHVQSLTHRYKLWKEILKLRGIKDW